MDSDREWVCEPTTYETDRFRRRGAQARSVMTEFDVVVVRTEGSAVLRVCGELDMLTAPLLYEQLVGLADEGVLDVTLDLADLDFIDSSGLQVLVAGLKRLRHQGGDLGLRSPNPRARNVLEITGLTSVFRVEPVDGADTSTPSPDRAATLSTDR